VRVLIVEDSVDALEMLRVLIELEGYDVCSAANGLDALRVAGAERPDVALIDIGLPGIDGVEVCRRIRAEPWGRAMFLVAQTGWGDETDRQRCAQAGFDVHLTKPVEPSKLTSLLAERRRAGVAGSQPSGSGGPSPSY
jgi:CheY-like chemotaxis protein